MWRPPTQGIAYFGNVYSPVQRTFSLLPTPHLTGSSVTLITSFGFEIPVPIRPFWILSSDNFWRLL